MATAAVHEGPEAEAKDHHAPLGMTLDGQRAFEIPQLASQMEWLIYCWYSIPALACWLCLLLSLSVFVWFDQPYLLVVLAIFWRAMYNAGIGWLLIQQSRTAYMTNFVNNLRKRPLSPLTRSLSFAVSLYRSLAIQKKLQHKKRRSTRRLLVNGCGICAMPDQINDPNVPPAFSAWTIFRFMVTFVEFNDAFVFVLMSIKFAMIERGTPVQFDGILASVSTTMFCVVDVLACLLICGSLYSKLAAFRVAGDYCWYYGDFFFVRTGKPGFSSEGIFEMFPHPMYTVGYGWTYGCAILSRSFVILACVITFHLSQLLFLTLVELPHVDRLYSSGRGEASGPSSPRTRTNRIHAKTAKPPSLLYFWKPILPQPQSIPKIDLFDGYDVSTLFMLLFFVLGTVLGSFPGGPLDSDMFFLNNAMFWRLASCGFETFVLVRQERSDWWSKRFTSQGYTRQDAFDSWKKIATTLGSLHFASFVLAAVRVARSPTAVTAAFVSRLLVGVLLVVTSMWSLLSCLEVTGWFGWFYGDFFLEPSASSAAGLTYQGIYRYLNNPEVYLGHLWAYGAAAVASSWEVVVLALFSHAMKIAFLQVVEKPHMRTIYKQRVRKHSVVSRKAREKVSDIKNKIQQNETTLFLANWIRHPLETGALAPSSKQLARAMCDTMRIDHDCVVLELGPGTGSFTREILTRLQGKRQATYIGFELSELFVNKLKVLFPSHAHCFVQESAEHLLSVMARFEVQQADTVISGLPWAVFSSQLQRDILSAVRDALKPGGRFCTFAYLQGLVMPAGQRFKTLLDEVFDVVERSSVVWKNFPPAFVYRCEKRS